MSKSDESEGSRAIHGGGEKKGRTNFLDYETAPLMADLIAFDAVLSSARGAFRNPRAMSLEVSHIDDDRLQAALHSGFLLTVGAAARLMSSSPSVHFICRTRQLLPLPSQPSSSNSGNADGLAEG
jgi:hypothetical protein